MSIEEETMSIFLAYVEEQSPRTDVSAIKTTTRLSDIGVDSALLIAAVGHCEDHWNVTISEESLTSIATVDAFLSEIVRAIEGVRGL